MPVSLQNAQKNTKSSELSRKTHWISPPWIETAKTHFFYGDAIKESVGIGVEQGDFFLEFEHWLGDDSTELHRIIIIFGSFWSATDWCGVANSEIGGAKRCSKIECSMQVMETTCIW
jgi:hypothetical protein